MGSNTMSSSINKNILMEELGLRQYSNTTIFTKGNIFVLSPSVQNSHSWFDLRKINIDRFDENHNNGFLILRYLDKLLLTELKEFKLKMMPEDKTVFTKSMGIHWKFNIVNQNGRYSVVNQQNRNFKYPMIKVAPEELKQMI